MSLINLIKNIFIAIRILRQEKPDVVISTGAGVAIAFILVAKLLKIPTIYIESITRNEELSLTATVIYPFVDRLFVQWKDLSEKYKKAEP